MIAAAMLTAYLIGSIPFAILAGYMISGEDIRTKGSGNAGAANVLRVLGWKTAVPVMIADFLKAFLPVYFAPSIVAVISMENISLEFFQIGMLFFLILGHVFPVWAKFKGGKGVASAAGGLSALFPPVVPFCLIIFALSVFIWKYVSLASLITAWSLPVYYIVFIQISNREFSLSLFLFFIIAAILISILHTANIKRLIKGEESRIRFRNTHHE